MKYLVIVLFFFSVSIHGQNCKYLINKVSGMDGTRLVITEPEILTNNFEDGSVKVWATIYGDTSVVVAFVIKSKKELFLPRADSIVLHLETGEVVFLELIQDAVIKQEGNNTLLTALTKIDRSAIVKFQNHAIEKIMIHSGDQKMEGSPGKKDQAFAIRTSVHCVVDYLKEIN